MFHVLSFVAIWFCPHLRHLISTLCMVLIYFYWLDVVAFKIIVVPDCFQSSRMILTHCVQCYRKRALDLSCENRYARQSHRHTLDMSIFISRLLDVDFSMADLYLSSFVARDFFCVSSVFSLHTSLAVMGVSVILFLASVQFQLSVLLQLISFCITQIIVYINRALSPKSNV